MYPLKQSIVSVVKKLLQKAFSPHLSSDVLQVNIIPYPRSITLREDFFSTEHLTVDAITYQTYQIFFDYLSKKYTVLIKESATPNIIFAPSKNLSDCAYNIEVDNNGIKVYSNTFSGGLYALTTLAQIVQKTNEGICVQHCMINDSPSYVWRGLHVDVARHMFSIVFLKELIADLAFRKINTLHLHLTDDQGWRFELKKYPLLHEIGGSRHETVVGKYFPFFGSRYVGDKQRYGGYYTQAELRDLVAYASDFGITIVPEIDIPGHMTAALAAYPQYAASKAPERTATYWGVFDNVVNPSEKSIDFLCDIFDELLDIFPSQYIHIGGDEVSEKKYKTDNTTKRLIATDILKNPGEADHYILRRVAGHITQHGRNVVAWDEAREVVRAVGGKTMIWRDEKYAHEALESGGSVILSPVSHMYFDYYQKNPIEEPLAIGGYTPIDVVYSYRAPEHTNGEIYGIQANLWTEYIRTESYARYMLFPRVYALSEVAWGTNTSWPSFKSRIDALHSQT